MNEITQEEFEKLETAPLPDKELINKSTGNHSPEDIFTGMHQIFYPRFATLVGKLSSNQLRRLIRALIESPLVQHKLTDKVTKEAFNIGEKLLLSKMALIMHAMKLENEKVPQTEAEIAAVVETLNTTGETNVGTENV